MPLDYDDVKRVFAEKLYHDTSGKGRLEAAFFAAIKYAYAEGVKDGSTPLPQNQPNERTDK